LALCLFAVLIFSAAALAQPGQIISNAGSDRTPVPNAPEPNLQAQAVGTGEKTNSTSAIATGDPQDQQSGSEDGTLKKPIQQNPVDSGQLPQTKRILGIIPNFRSVSTDEKLPPMSPKEKFLTATSDSFDYSSIFIPAMLAAYSMGTDAYPEFGQGAEGYGQYFWHAAVDQTIENYMVEFVFPVATHEDNRYYTLGRGGFLKRTGYALSRAVITRSDSGREEFNISEVVGAGASAGLSSLYYPEKERTFGNVASSWSIDVGIDAASFVAKEFWPNINHWLFHRSSDIDGDAR
jgi:hypothetical protein